MEKETEPVTCGVLYAKQLSRYCGTDPGKVRLFSIGMATGQAEKVYLGACLGAMFRPAAEHFSDFRLAILQVAKAYGLHYQELDAGGPAPEMWLLRNEIALSLFAGLSKEPLNSPRWHKLRGNLCGVPWNETDLKFHERRGYQERCEPVIQEDWTDEETQRKWQQEGRSR